MEENIYNKTCIKCGKTYYSIGITSKLIFKKITNKLNI